MFRKSPLVALLVAVILAVSSVAAFACTSILVPPSSSVDGSASVTHTCDSGSSPFEVIKVPAADWAPGTMTDVLDLPQFTSGNQMHVAAGEPTGNKIPQVAHTYGYIRALFGVINEKQVSIGETTISGRRESQNPAGFFDITNLSMYAMERAATAREAVKVMGELGEKYGYKDGGEELSVADTKECWVFEMVGPGPLWQQGDEGPGAYWVAQRVPEGHVSASANNAVIREIDFNDHENFMFAPGIVEYAVSKGWYKPESGEPFNWRKHFCNATSFETSGRRVWRVFCLAAPSLAEKLDERDLPFSAPVDKKLSISDINAIQRDHYEGTKFYGGNSLAAGPFNNPRRYRGLGFKVDGKNYSWERMIAQVQCEYSICTQSRGWLPDEIGGLVWYGATNPDLTCYVPLYASMTSVSPAMNTKAGSHQEFTRDSYWWAISAVSTYADLKWSYMSKDIKANIDKYEGHALRTQGAIEAAALELHKQDPKLAVEFLTNYANRNVETVRDAWWQLLDTLIWKYNMGFVTEDGRVRSVSYPEAWLRKVVGSGEPGHWAK
ncbi:MAG: C69 family dipeptidase [Clostridia bacterium]|nr:C69 family dipeptidase [Clostridia bacterium]